MIGPLQLHLNPCRFARRACQGAYWGLPLPGRAGPVRPLLAWQVPTPADRYRSSAIGQRTYGGGRHAVPASPSRVPVIDARPRFRTRVHAPFPSWLPRTEHGAPESDTVRYSARRERCIQKPMAFLNPLCT